MPGSVTLVGLMSGTSTDGVDAALVRLSVEEGRERVELLGFVSRPYATDIRERLLACAAGRASVADVARANVLLGNDLADAAEEVITAAGLSPADVAAIGSHGHTVAHLPVPGGPLEPAATLQIGEPAVIAERLGVPVVSDFRTRDMAAGGQGAPLVPSFDQAFLQAERTGRIALNIGGISNITVLPPLTRPGPILAYDIGPGNMPLDAAVSLWGPSGWTHDRDGTLASSGLAQPAIVRFVLDHEFFERPAPRSCGREEFGEGFVRAAYAVAPDVPVADLVASLTEAVGRAIAAELGAASGDGTTWEVIASGGGTHNPALMGAIRRHTRLPIRLSDELGVPSDAKEAMAFAHLAWLTLEGRPGNIAAATGARGPRVLGRITPP